jgi:hypothetical protein
MSDGNSLIGGDAGASAPATSATDVATELAPVDGGGNPAPSAPEWMSGFEGIDPDIAGDTSLKAIQDVPSLIKSYVHAQRKMGADKAIIPTANSTEEERAAFYHKMGLPTDFGEYNMKAAENAVLKEDMMEAFRKTAYDNRLLPDQAQAMFDFLNNHTNDEISRMQESQQEEYTAKIGNLKEEWGEAFEQNVHTAKLAVNEFGGDDFKQYLNESGLGNDPAVIKVFNEIGKKFFAEDSFEGASKPAYSLAPDEAQKRIGEIQGDMNGAYYNNMHPDHKRTVEEVNKLFQMLGR